MSFSSPRYHGGQVGDSRMRSTGFPKKRDPFLKIENIPGLLSDLAESKILENIDFKYFSNRASFKGNPVCSLLFALSRKLFSIIFLRHLVPLQEMLFYPCNELATLSQFFLDHSPRRHCSTLLPWNMDQ